MRDKDRGERVQKQVNKKVKRYSQAIYLLEGEQHCVLIGIKNYFVPSDRMLFEIRP